jgi:hypothetical protein
MKKRENFLYFSQLGKQKLTYRVTATNVGTDWNGDALQTVAVDSLFDRANKGTVGSIVDVRVKSAVAAEDVRGTDYTDTPTVNGATPAAADDVVVGQTTILETEAYDTALTGSAGSEVMSIHKPTGSSHGDTAHGYLLAAGDEIKVERVIKEGEAVIYPADMYIGASFSSDTVTVLHFNSMNGKERDDTITVTHATGKYKEVADLVQRCAEANPFTKGGFIRVIDLFSDPNVIATHDQDELGITNCVIAIA